MFKNGVYIKGERKLVIQLGNNWIELKTAIQNKEFGCASNKVTSPNK